MIPLDVNLVLLNEFVEWLKYYQEIRLDELHGIPSKDPVIQLDRARGIHNCRLEDIYRFQNHLDKFEQTICVGQTDATKVARILFFRHSWSIPLTKLYIKGELTRDTMEQARMSASCHSEYIYTGVMWPFIHARNGVTREDNILEHANTVDHLSEMTWAVLKNKKTAQEVVDHIQEFYPLLGPFRAYEVYTSFCYRLDDFKFTCNDFLHVGPGSKIIEKELFGRKMVLADALNLVNYINHHLLPPWMPRLDVKSMEDGFCEFRKYRAMKQDLEHPELRQGRILREVMSAIEDNLLPGDILHFPNFL